MGWDGRLLANASIEMEVFVSNTSHVLHVFEYTKENNVKGVQFLIPQPPGGWRAATWQSFTIPIQVPRGPLKTSLPSLPSLPALPSLPSLPSLPALPSLPSLPWHLIIT